MGVWHLEPWAGGLSQTPPYEVPKIGMVVLGLCCRGEQAQRRKPTVMEAARAFRRPRKIARALIVRLICGAWTRTGLYIIEVSTMSITQNTNSETTLVT